jgi:hypothetical protein
MWTVLDDRRRKMMRFARDRMRLPAATSAVLCLSIALAACGSSAHKSTSAAAQSVTTGALATSQAVSAASTTTTTSTHRHKAAAAKKAKSGSGADKHTSSHSQSTHASAPSTTTTASHTTTTHSTTTSHTTPAAPTVHGLPSPEITATSGKVRGWLHASDHTPKAGKRWYYQVLAADLSGHPLAGTADTEFAFNGTVVGRETPPSHPLKQGLMKDGVVFPARAEGIPLTFQIVIHTHLGSVTLDWAVKVHK